MSGSSEMAFVAPRGLARRRTALALVVAVAAAGLLLGEQARLDTLRDDVERIEARVDQRRQAAERAARKRQRVSAEAHRIERLLDEQSISDGNTGLPVLDWIERAWTPRIARARYRSTRPARKPGSKAARPTSNISTASRIACGMRTRNAGSACCGIRCGTSRAVEPTHSA